MRVILNIGRVKTDSERVKTDSERVKTDSGACHFGFRCVSFWIRVCVILNIGFVKRKTKKPFESFEGFLDYLGISLNVLPLLVL